MKLGKYLLTFKNFWQVQLEYRFNTIIHFIIAMISMIGVFYLWSNVFGERAELMGYSKEQIVTYYLIVVYLFAAIFPWIPIAEEIREGRLSVYMTKPISYIAHTYWMNLSKTIFRMVVGLPILILIFIIFREHLFFVTDPIAYLTLIITALGAVNILFLFAVLMALIEFWVKFSETITMVTDIAASLFTGTWIPIVFLPLYIQNIANFLPFKYTGYFIIESFLGRLSFEQLFIGIGIQLLWTFVLLGIVKIVWIRGLKRYEAYGA